LQLGFALLTFSLLLHGILLSATHFCFLLKCHLVLQFSLFVLAPCLQVAHEVFSLLGAWMVDTIEILVKMLLFDGFYLVAQFILKGLLTHLLPQTAQFTLDLSLLELDEAILILVF
jgi:hypothetical protein